MAIRLSSSEYSSQCRRWKEKKKTVKNRVEVEEENVELKEKRTCTWMTSDETQILSQCDV